MQNRSTNKWQLTAEGSLSQKASRQMLHASSHASWMPPSTKAAADVKLSILAFSSVSDAIVESQPWNQTGKRRVVQNLEFNFSIAKILSCWVEDKYVQIFIGFIIRSKFLTVLKKLRYSSNLIHLLLNSPAEILITLRRGEYDTRKMINLKQHSVRKQQDPFCRIGAAYLSFTFYPTSST